MKCNQMLNTWLGGQDELSQLSENHGFTNGRKKRQSERLAALRAPYLKKLKERFGDDTSIICSNCFAGRIMQDIGMQYNTPTLGLYFWAPDYIEFLQHLEFYLKEAKIEFVEHSKYPLGDERRAKWKHWYPIGRLDGKVEIHFLHYHSEEEATEKWYRRASRVHLDNLFIIGMEQNLCTEKEIREFDKLPFKDKIFFSSKNLPEVKSNCFVAEFEEKEEIGDPYKKGHILYRYFVWNILIYEEKETILNQ